MIVDPDGAEVPDGSVGEVWLHGVNIARGYFGREEETRRAFGNKLQSRLDKGSHAEGAPDNGCWLATGDLGVYLSGELYLTGRIKDLIILDGSNHYPTDIETTVSEASPAIRNGYVAAFSVPADAVDSPGSAGAGRRDRRARGRGGPRRPRAGRRGSAGSGLARSPHPDRRPQTGVRGRHSRTTSGKLARSACRAEYLRGRVQPLTDSHGPSQSQRFFDVARRSGERQPDEPVPLARYRSPRPVRWQHRCRPTALNKKP